MRTVPVLILLVLLFFPALTNAAQFSDDPIDSVVYHASERILSQGIPYSITLFNCLAYTGNDVGPLSWFNISDSVNMAYIDSIGLFGAGAFWHKNAINQYYVEGGYKRYLFQGLCGGYLAVYDITDSAYASLVTYDEFDEPLDAWVQDVYVYDTVILCSVNGPWFAGGLYVFDFDPGSETLYLDTILQDSSVFYQSTRNASHIYSLRELSSSKRLIVDIFSTSDYSLLASDTSNSQLTIETFTNDNHSFVMVADSFTMESTVFDTLVFVPIFDSVGEHLYPNPLNPNDSLIGINYDIKLWIIDFDTNGLTSSYVTVAQSVEIDDESMSAYDTKYSNSHIFVGTSKEHIYAIDISDTSDVFIADTIIGHNVYDMAIRPDLDGGQDLFFASQTDEGDTVYTTLYRYDFDASKGAYLAGDYNADSLVNVSDLVNIGNYISGAPQGYPAVPLGRGDVNGDGYLNVNDFFYLYNYIFNGGPAPRCNCVN